MNTTTVSVNTTAKRRINIKAYIRSIVALMLISMWTLTASTGFLLWLAPSGQRSGQIPLLFDWTRHEWGEVHFWMSVTALSITLLHLVIDWRALYGCIRYLIGTHRNAKSCSKT